MSVRQSEPAIVLLHELGGCGRSWDFVRQHLDPNLRTVLTPTYLDGASVPEGSSVDICDLANDIGRELLQRGIEHWIVGGVAYGSVVGAALARTHPENVRGLLWSSMSSQLHEDIHEFIAERNAQFLGEGVEQTVEASLRRTYPHLFRWMSVSRYSHYRDLLSSESANRYIAFSKSLAVAAPRLPELIQGVVCHCVVVACSQDAHFSTGEVLEVGRLVSGPSSSRTLFSGHFPHVQRPRALARLLETTVRRAV